MRGPFRKKKREIDFERFDQELWRKYCVLAIREMQSQKKMRDKAVRLSKRRRQNWVV